MAPLPLVMLDQLDRNVAQVPSANAHQLRARQQVDLMAVVAKIEHLVDAVQCSSKPPRQAELEY